MYVQSIKFTLGVPEWFYFLCKMLWTNVNLILLHISAVLLSTTRWCSGLRIHSDRVYMHHVCI